MRRTPKKYLIGPISCKWNSDLDVCVTHPSRFKQNRGPLFLFYTITRQDYAAFKNNMQMCKHQRPSMSLAPHGSETQTCLHLPFQSSNSYRRGFLKALLHSCFLVRLRTRKLHCSVTSKSFSLSNDLICISYISLSTFVCFPRQFQFCRPQFKLPRATKVYVSVWQLQWRVSNRATSHHSRL